MQRVRPRTERASRPRPPAAQRVSQRVAGRRDRRLCVRPRLLLSQRRAVLHALRGRLSHARRGLHWLRVRRAVGRGMVHVQRVHLPRGHDRGQRRLPQNRRPALRGRPGVRVGAVRPRQVRVNLRDRRTRRQRRVRLLADRDALHRGGRGRGRLLQPGDRCRQLWQVRHCVPGAVHVCGEPRVHRWPAMRMRRHTRGAAAVFAVPAGGAVCGCGSCDRKRGGASQLSSPCATMHTRQHMPSPRPTPALQNGACVCQVSAAAPARACASAWVARTPREPQQARAAARGAPFSTLKTHLPSTQYKPGGPAASVCARHRGQVHPRVGVRRREFDARV